MHQRVRLYATVFLLAWAVDLVGALHMPRNTVSLIRAAQHGAFGRSQPHVVAAAKKVDVALAGDGQVKVHHDAASRVVKSSEIVGRLMSRKVEEQKAIEVCMSDQECAMQEAQQLGEQLKAFVDSRGYKKVRACCAHTAPHMLCTDVIVCSLARSPS